MCVGVVCHIEGWSELSVDTFLARTHGWSLAHQDLVATAVDKRHGRGFWAREHEGTTLHLDLIVHFTCKKDVVLFN